MFIFIASNKTIGNKHHIEINIKLNYLPLMNMDIRYQSDKTMWICTRAMFSWSVSLRWWSAFLVPILKQNCEKGNNIKYLYSKDHLNIQTY